MSSAPNSSAGKPSVAYHISNVAFDLATMGVFTARYKHGWPNAWTSDGRSYLETNADGTHEHYYSASAARQHRQQRQQASLEKERE
jgi:hypothetical protein